MDNLYYQPEIEEFYIGFEYEQELNNYNWRKMMRPPSDNFEWIKFDFNTSTSLSKIQKEIKEEKIRVKYLDIEDLESLGWQPYDNYWVKPFGAKLELHYILFPTRLQYVEINDRAYEIKNKSELERLMRWLKI